MNVDPKDIHVISKYYGNDTATYRYKEYTFRADREDWHNIEKYGIIPEYCAVPVDKPKDKENNIELNKLFVYGIFLGKGAREAYGMSNPGYATVPGFITVGGQIVEAIRVDSDKVMLTGLLVDVDPSKWERIDKLESNYDRIKVKTYTRIEAWMYVAKGQK